MGDELQMVWLVDSAGGELPENRIIGAQRNCCKTSTNCANCRITREGAGSIQGKTRLLLGIGQEYGDPTLRGFAKRAPSSKNTAISVQIEQLLRYNHGMLIVCTCGSYLPTYGA